MLHQKMLLEKEHYFISCDYAPAFEIHRHPEIELSYCVEGSYDLFVDNKKYTLHKGDLAIVTPMSAHEFPEPEKGLAKRITIEVGPFLLGEHFDSFIHMDSSHIIINLNDESTEGYSTLKMLLNDILMLHESKPDFYNLFITSNLYKICAILLKSIQNPSDKKLANKRINIVNIDKSLDIIFNRYHEPLSIDEVSAECGYSKSNFCKIFKSIIGDTFHNVLNNRRIEVSCMLLKNSNMPIEEIAHNVGFLDLKGFCRVFKRIMNENAGTYRKRHIKE